MGFYFCSSLVLSRVAFNRSQDLCTTKAYLHPCSVSNKRPQSEHAHKADPPSLLEQFSVGGALALSGPAGPDDIVI